MIVVTGAAGFIGSVLVWMLNQRGETDILTVDVHPSDAGEPNLAPLKYDHGYASHERFREDRDGEWQMHAIRRHPGSGDRLTRQVAIVIRGVELKDADLKEFVQREVKQRHLVGLGHKVLRMQRRRDAREKDTDREAHRCGPGSAFHTCCVHAILSAENGCLAITNH